MRKSIIAVLGVAFVLAAFWGCQSPEMTSAKVYIQQKEYDQALIQLKKEIEKNPTNAEAYFLAGQLYGEMDSLDKMVEMFNKAEELDTSYRAEIIKWRRSKSAEAFNKGLKAWKRKKDLEKSLKWTYMAIKIDSTNVNAYKNLGFLYQQKQMKFEQEGNKDSAQYYIDKRIEVYRKAHFMDPDDEELAAILAALYTAENMPPSSISILELYIGKAQNPKVYSAAADAYDQLGQTEKALQMLTHMEKLDPNDAGVLFDIGVRYYNMEKYDEAAQYFDKVLKIKPDDVNALNNKGLALFNAGKLDEAEKIFVELVKKKPDVADYWSALAVTWAKMEKGKKATTAFDIQKALEAGDKDKAKKLIKKLNLGITLD